MGNGLATVVDSGGVLPVTGRCRGSAALGSCIDVESMQDHATDTTIEPEPCPTIYGLARAGKKCRGPGSRACSPNSVIPITGPDRWAPSC